MRWLHLTPAVRSASGARGARRCGAPGHWLPGAYRPRPESHATGTSVAPSPISHPAVASLSGELSDLSDHGGGADCRGALHGESSY
eukprot:747436-Hanusia_phi.AAC.4